MLLYPAVQRTRTVDRVHGVIFRSVKLPVLPESTFGYPDTLLIAILPLVVHAPVFVVPVFVLPVFVVPVFVLPVFVVPEQEDGSPFPFGVNTIVSASLSHSFRFPVPVVNM